MNGPIRGAQVIAHHDGARIEEAQPPVRVADDPLGERDQFGGGCAGGLEQADRERRGPLHVRLQVGALVRGPCVEVVLAEDQIVTVAVHFPVLYEFQSA